MKKVILILMLMISTLGYSQSFDYQFKIQDVTTVTDAKNITDSLITFFKVYPIFDDSTDTFGFISDEDISEDMIPFTFILFNKTLIKSNKLTKI